jgi:hypothetical protein
MHQHNVTWRNKQLGMSKWGWLFVVGVLALGSSTALRVGPHYIDFRIVQATMDRLQASEVHSMSRAKINEHFEKQLRVENFTLKVRDIMEIDRDREKTQIIVFYEVREPLLYNADIVLTFSEQRSYP